MFLPKPRSPAILIHVVKLREAKQRNSFGVAFDLLAIGPQSMVTKMHYLKENVIPFHSHPNEQTGYILSGRIRVLTRDSRHELDPGDTYAIPANIRAQHMIFGVWEGAPGLHPARGSFPLISITPYPADSRAHLFGASSRPSWCRLPQTNAECHVPIVRQRSPRRRVVQPALSRRTCATQTMGGATLEPCREICSER